MKVSTRRVLTIFAAVAAVSMAVLTVSAARLTEKTGTRFMFNCSLDTHVYVLCNSTDVVDGVEMCYGDSFASADGKVFLPEDGYPPCEYSTCIGMYCPAEKGVVAQVYQSAIGNPSNLYPLASDRILCGCLDLATSKFDYTSTMVLPESPYSKQNDATCAKDYQCENITRYLNVNTTTSECECCDKPLTALVLTSTCANAGEPSEVVVTTAAPLPEFSDFVHSICPGVSASVTNTALWEAAGEFCCYVHTSDANGTETLGHACGKAVMAVTSAMLECVWKNVGDPGSFTCCSSVDGTGATTYIGAVCDARGSSDGALTLRSAMTAALVTFATLLLVTVVG